MPNITVTYQRETEQTVAEAHETVREMLEEEKAKIANAAGFSPDPSWQMASGDILTATLPYVDPEYVEPEPEPESEEAAGTCETVKINGEVCGWELPCRWHKF